LDDVQILNVETLQWASPFLRHALTPPRGDHSTVLVDDKLFVFGGRNFSGECMAEW
jgi:hypothetical protein